MGKCNHHDSTEYILNSLNSDLSISIGEKEVGEKNPKTSPGISELQSYSSKASLLQLKHGFRRKEGKWAYLVLCSFNITRMHEK